MQGRRTARQRSSVQLTTLRDLSEPGSIDPACLEVYSSHLHPDLPNGYIHHFSTTPAPSTGPRKCCMLCAPVTPTCHAPYPVTIPITHARIYPQLAFYCSPSGLSELLPARRISSVDNRLTAITELRHRTWQDKGLGLIDTCQPAEMKGWKV